MQKLQNTIFWTIIMSETMHVFCCVLPTVISILSLLTGLGVVSLLPAGLLAFHDFMHHWEVPMIIMSGVVLVFGWVLHGISLRLDCRSTGCGHEPCSRKKNKSSYVLWGATGLFAVNTAIYFIFHAHMS